ncbi:MAG TPA: acetyl-CoA acetyltransferase [Stellaceae bacterium]
MEHISKSPLAIYQEHLERGELAYQWSPEANRAVFYPRVLCPFTGSERLEWRLSAGLGTVYATTVTHPREGAPYNVALIDIDEGFRLMSRVEDAAPEDVRIGMRVEFRVHRPGGDEPACPVFTPAAAAPTTSSPAGGEGSPKSREGVLNSPSPAGGGGSGRGPLHRGSVAIVGVAESDLGAVAADMSAIDLMAQGIHRALADCGLALKDVDGLVCATAQSRTSGLNLAEYLGISPAFIDTTILGGSSFMFHVAHAQAALQLGLCNVAVIAYGSTQRTIGRRHASVREYNPYETPFRPFLPSTAYALAASRHMYQYGTTREQLAAVAVAARQWATLNPVAWEKKPLSVEDVLNARMISWPFTVRDICLVTDGGGAVVMTTPERARSLQKPPVYVLGCGQAITHANISSMPDLTVTGAAASGRQAYAMAGLGPAEIDVLELYDAFTINPILFLEDLGFCQKGEGGPFVEGGRIAPGGALPVNTNGGGLSYCHPGMYGLFLLIEAARQLRGECGPRQVADCEVALAHGNGGVLSSQSTVILGTQAAL